MGCADLERPGVAVVLYAGYDLGTLDCPCNHASAHLHEEPIAVKLRHWAAVWRRVGVMLLLLPIGVFFRIFSTGWLAIQVSVICSLMPPPPPPAAPPNLLKQVDQESSHPAINCETQDIVTSKDMVHKAMHKATVSLCKSCGRGRGLTEPA